MFDDESLSSMEDLSEWAIKSRRITSGVVPVGELKRRKESEEASDVSKIKKMDFDPVSSDDSFSSYFLFRKALEDQRIIEEKKEGARKILDRVGEHVRKHSKFRRVFNAETQRYDYVYQNNPDFMKRFVLVLDDPVYNVLPLPQSVVSIDGAYLEAEIPFRIIDEKKKFIKDGKTEAKIFIGDLDLEEEYRWEAQECNSRILEKDAKEIEKNVVFEEVWNPQARRFDYRYKKYDTTLPTMEDATLGYVPTEYRLAIADHRIKPAVHRIPVRINIAEADRARNEALLSDYCEEVMYDISVGKNQVLEPIFSYSSGRDSVLRFLKGMKYENVN